MDPKHKGSLTETKAKACLLEAGYEVFDNISAHGPIDLIAFLHDEIILIDVKTGNTREGEYRYFDSRTDRQKEIGVKLMYVYSDGHWKIVEENEYWVTRNRTKCKKVST